MRILFKRVLCLHLFEKWTDAAKPLKPANVRQCISMMLIVTMIGKQITHETMRNRYT